MIEGASINGYNTDGVEAMNLSSSSGQVNYGADHTSVWTKKSQICRTMTLISPLAVVVESQIR